LSASVKLPETGTPAVIVTAAAHVSLATVPAAETVRVYAPVVAAESATMKTGTPAVPRKLKAETALLSALLAVQLAAAPHVAESHTCSEVKPVAVTR